MEEQEESSGTRWVPRGTRFGSHGTGEISTNWKAPSRATKMVTGWSTRCMRWILLQETLIPATPVHLTPKFSQGILDALTLSLWGSMNPCPWGEKPGDVIQLHEAPSTEPLNDTLTKAPGLESPKCSSQKAT